MEQGEAPRQTAKGLTQRLALAAAEYLGTEGASEVTIHLFHQYLLQPSFCSADRVGRTWKLFLSRVAVPQELKVKDASFYDGKVRI